jgi:hypothetical protein
MDAVDFLDGVNNSSLFTQALGVHQVRGVHQVHALFPPSCVRLGVPAYSPFRSIPWNRSSSPDFM